MQWLKTSRPVDPHICYPSQTPNNQIMIQHIDVWLWEICKSFTYLILCNVFLGGEPFLLLANRVDIRKVVPSARRASEYTSVVRGLENAISLDVHLRRGLIYWTDVTLDSIKCTYINTSSSSSSAAAAAAATDVVDVINTGLDSPGASIVVLDSSFIIIIYCCLVSRCCFAYRYINIHAVLHLPSLGSAMLLRFAAWVGGVCRPARDD